MNKELKCWHDELIRCAKSGTKPPYPANPFPPQSVLIVAGSCLDESGLEWNQFVAALENKLSNFNGRVISGGTLAGVCREVGRLSAQLPDTERKWTSVGYLPRSTPQNLIDKRYDEHIYTDGTTFSEIEPLQYWTDLLSSGISLAQITLMRYRGGAITSYELKLASDLGSDIIVENIKKNHSKNKGGIRETE